MEEARVVQLRVAQLRLAVARSSAGKAPVIIQCIKYYIELNHIESIIFCRGVASAHGVRPKLSAGAIR